VPDWRYRLKEFVVNWFRRDAFGSPAGEWLALAVVILLSFALCIALSTLVWWLRTREREADEGEKDYWRIHE
jgi:Zn-dependent protease with chaperone function